MNDNEKLGLLSLVVIVIGLIVSTFAVIHAITALLPMAIVGAIVAGLLYMKFKS